MKKTLLYSFLLTAFGLYGQNVPKDSIYSQLVEQAFKHLEAKECEPCLVKYEQAFARSKHSALSHMRAAVCAELCNETQHREKLIGDAVAIDWSVCRRLLKDTKNYPEFKSLQGQSFGAKTMELVHLKAKEAGINLALSDELEQIRYDDQKYRLWLDSVRAVHPDRNSPEYQAFVKEWMANDSVQMVKIEAILDQYGYPGKSLVGQESSGVAWLVIQHAPLEKQEKYLPLITESAEKGECSKSNWAYLVDRINMRKGLPQIYGSQVTTSKDTGKPMFHPIEDEGNVNKRRSEVGLGPLEEYAARMGVEWTLPTKKD